MARKTENSFKNKALIFTIRSKTHKRLIFQDKANIISAFSYTPLKQTNLEIDSENEHLESGSLILT